MSTEALEQPKKRTGTSSKKQTKEFRLYLEPAKYDDLLQTCQFCMKMCRFACPVAEAEKSELLTPWGKVSAIGQHTGTENDWALTSFECNHCGLCSAHCKHENPVEALLTKQRAVIADKYVPQNKKDAKEKIRKNYKKIYPIQPPEKKKESVLFWPAMGMDRYDRIRKGKEVDEFFNPFAGKAKKVIESIALPENTYEAYPQDTGFDLYSAGLEDEFLAHVDYVRQELDKFETVVFESALDYYVLKGILGRYGSFVLGNYKSFYQYVAENALPSMRRLEGGSPWILWLDGFTGRGLNLAEGDYVKTILDAIEPSPETWLPPDGIHRPNLFSEGFYYHYDQMKVRKLAGPAVDVLADFRGDVVFTSLRDYEYASNFKGIKRVYLVDWIARAKS